MNDRVPSIEGVDLVRTYEHGAGKVSALRGVDIAVHPGEFVAVTGPSGSGKSTLLHLLAGIDRPDAGEVRIEGRSLGGLSEDELSLLRRRRIGIVLQLYNLLPTLTARENAAFPMLLDGVDDADARAAAALERVGLAHRATHHPADLSGGEQQRVAIARALVTKPAAILADEPTGALDSLAAEDIMKLLREVADEGQTVILVTHDPLAASFADRVVRVRDGAVVLEDGEPRS